MERVTGIGGFFFRSRDRAGLADWYSRRIHDPEGNPIELWEPSVEGGDRG